MCYKISLPKAFKILLALLITPLAGYSQYSGTASVTQGIANATTNNLFACNGARITKQGSIKSSDSSIWTVPATVNYTNNLFPFASDLYNDCNGHTYSDAKAAVNALNGSDIISVDTDGELITAYVFADNYFEMYINGIPVGKDKVPYTPFNSSLLRFKVKRPFTIAMHLVDWEENLGLGSEVNGGKSYHAGDGGLVAVFVDTNNSIIAKTDSNWKAQTYYTSPIKDLKCPTENGSLRLSDNCNTDDALDGSQFYGLHWSKPSNWMMVNYDDSNWPNASVFSNTTVGVNNKPAYTNFVEIFDKTPSDAQFIWSTNLILDNEVIVRFKVDGSATSIQSSNTQPQIEIYPNPSNGHMEIKAKSTIQNITIFNDQGQIIHIHNVNDKSFVLNQLNAGIYWIKIITPESTISKKIIVL